MRLPSREPVPPISTSVPALARTDFGDPLTDNRAVGLLRTTSPPTVPLSPHTHRRVPACSSQPLAPPVRRTAFNIIVVWEDAGIRCSTARATHSWRIAGIPCRSRALSEDSHITDCCDSRVPGRAARVRECTYRSPPPHSGAWAFSGFSVRLGTFRHCHRRGIRGIIATNTVSAPGISRLGDRLTTVSPTAATLPDCGHPVSPRAPHRVV